MTGHRDTAVLARGGLLNLFGTAVYGALGFAFIVVVTRGLGASRAGPFFEAVALFSILGRTAMLGVDVGLVRFVARALALGRVDDVVPLVRTALVPVAAIGAVGALTLFVAAAPLGHVLANGPESRELATYLRVLAPFVVAAAVYGALEATTRGFGTMLPSVVVERIGRSVAQPAALAAVLAVGGGALATGAAYALPYIAGAIALGWCVHSMLAQVRSTSSGPPEAADGDVADARAFWHFTAPRALSSIFQVALLWLDVLLVGALASSGEAGIYAAATRYLLMGTMAGQALTTAIQPQISALLARRSARRAGELFQVATAWTMLVSWPIFVSVIVFATPLLRVLGPGFDRAHPALVILGAAWLFASACGPVDVIQLMAGASRLNLANYGAAVAANVALNVILVPHLGITGAALAWMASIVITNAAPAVQVWRSLGIHPFGRGSALVATASVGLLFVELTVREVVGSGLVGLAVGVAVGGIAYLAVVTRRGTVLEGHALRAAFGRLAPATR